MLFKVLDLLRHSSELLFFSHVFAVLKLESAMLTRAKESPSNFSILIRIGLVNDSNSALVIYSESDENSDS